jgi:hypothetical protein
MAVDRSFEKVEEILLQIPGISSQRVYSLSKSAVRQIATAFPRCRVEADLTMLNLLEHMRQNEVDSLVLSREEFEQVVSNISYCISVQERTGPSAAIPMILDAIGKEGEPTTDIGGIIGEFMGSDTNRLKNQNAADSIVVTKGKIIKPYDGPEIRANTTMVPREFWHYMAALAKVKKITEFLELLDTYPALKKSLQTLYIATYYGILPHVEQVFTDFFQELDTNDFLLGLLGELIAIGLITCRGDTVDYVFSLIPTGNERETLLRMQPYSSLGKHHKYRPNYGRMDTLIPAANRLLNLGVPNLWNTVITNIFKGLEERQVPSFDTLAREIITEENRSMGWPEEVLKYFGGSPGQELELSLDRTPFAHMRLEHASLLLEILQQTAGNGLVVLLHPENLPEDAELPEDEDGLPSISVETALERTMDFPEGYLEFLENQLGVEILIILQEM